MGGGSHFVPAQNTSRVVARKMRPPHTDSVCFRVERSDRDTTRAAAGAVLPGSKWVDKDVDGIVVLPREGGGGKVDGMNEWAT